MKKIGVAITSYNEKDYVARCLSACVHQVDMAVVVENGGDDGTKEMIETRFKNVTILTGDHDIWWAEGTNIAIKKCLNEHCTHILVLNADVELHDTCVQELLSLSHPGVIVASLVLDRNDKSLVWWGGGCWVKRWKYLPVYGMKPIVKRRTPIDDIRETYYYSDDFHGRGVLIPAEIFRQCGFYDSQTFPHYGADNDFALRVKSHGIKVIINPQAHVYVDTDRTFLSHTRRSLLEKVHVIYSIVFDPDETHGLKLTWRLSKKHLPRGSVLATLVIRTRFFGDRE